MKNKYIILIIVLCVVALLCGVPLIINYCFKTFSIAEIFVAEWDANAALTYWGALLTFFSTTILSALALWQNDVIRKESSRHSLQLQLMEYRKVMPLFNIICASEYSEYQKMRIRICNISENPAFSVTITKAYISNTSRSLLEGQINKTVKTLFAQQTMETTCQNGPIYGREYLQIELLCFDIYRNEITYCYCGEINLDEKDIVCYIEKIDYTKVLHSLD